MSDAAASPPPQDANSAEPEQAQQQQEQQATELPGPGAFLKGVVGQPVVVRLNSGVDYRGPSPSPSPSP